jgi:ABC-type transporter Mla subunit MlaD
MKERIRPAPEAAERIRALGEKKIWQFLDEVTLGSARNLVKFLPVVHGFRPQSEAGLKQQKLSLAKKLSSKNGGADRDFFALYVMWRTWAWEQLGDPDTVDHLLDDLENVLTQPKPQDEGASKSVRAGTIAFLNALKELSLENKCSREKIVRLIEYSPLAVDDTGRQIVNSCKSVSDIERDKAITDLPNRLSADEKEIQSIKDQLGAITADVNAAAAKASPIEQKSDIHGQKLQSLAESIDRLSPALTAVEDSSKRNTETLGKLERRFDELASEFRSSGSRQDDLDGHLKSTAQFVSEAIRELRSIVESLQYKLSGMSPASTEAVESIVKDMQSLGAKVFGLSQGPRSEDIVALNMRLDALESTTPTETSTISATDPAGVSVTGLPCAPNSAAQPLADVGKIVGALSASLQSVGLKKSAAGLLAEEIAAAILTSQAVTFKGALAHLIASKCAQTLSNAHAWNISIPIGLTDGRSLSAALQAISSKSSTNVASIVIEGLNRSALDSTKDALLAYASDHNANRKPPIFFFISLVSGIASLPVEPEHLELGPVLDLDYLDWRLSPEGGAASATGSIAASVVASLRGRLTQGAANDIDETLRVLRKFMPKRNPRLERTVAAGYAALKNTRQGRVDASPMQSLAYGWLVPLWVALGLSKEDADSELDGGKCDAPNFDPRVAAMLSHEPFGSEQTESGR